MAACWKPLVLTGSAKKPEPGRLVALALKGGPRKEYRIGSFTREGRKLWWRDGHGCTAACDLTRRYDVWWKYTAPCPYMD